MLSTEYLYGDIIVPTVPQGLIDRKTALLRYHIVRLNRQPLMKIDLPRIHEALAAIEFWETINTK